MCSVQHGIAHDIMNDIFRKRNITYITKNSSGFEKRNIKIVHYQLETIAYLGPKIYGILFRRRKMIYKTSLNQTLNSRNQRDVHAFYVNYIYHKLSFF